MEKEELVDSPGHSCLQFRAGLTAVLGQLVCQSHWNSEAGDSGKAVGTPVSSGGVWFPTRVRTSCFLIVSHESAAGRKMRSAWSFEKLSHASGHQVLSPLKRVSMSSCGVEAQPMQAYWSFSLPRHWGVYLPLICPQRTMFSSSEVCSNPLMPICFSIPEVLGPIGSLRAMCLPKWGLWVTSHGIQFRLCWAVSIQPRCCDHSHLFPP